LGTVLYATAEGSERMARTGVIPLSYVIAKVMLFGVKGNTSCTNAVKD